MRAPGPCAAGLRALAAGLRAPWPRAAGLIALAGLGAPWLRPGAAGVGWLRAPWPCAAGPPGREPFCGISSARAARAAAGGVHWVSAPTPRLPCGSDKYYE